MYIYIYIRSSSSENKTYMRIVRTNLPDKNVLLFFIENMLLFGQKKNITFVLKKRWYFLAKNVLISENKIQKNKYITK